MDKTVETKAWGLVRRRQCLVPTWKGWLALVLVLGSLVTVMIRALPSFLAVTEPLPGGVMVVEGWAPDYTLQMVVAEFKRNHYDHVYVTGGPVDFGAPLVEYKTYAERGAAILEKLGLSTNDVQSVPAPFVAQDRTYTSAMTLRRWFRDHGVTPTRVHLVTEGMHARRSRLMFRRALGKSVQVGVTAVHARDFDEAHLWHYSAGVRGLISEGVAYVYAALLFHPPPEK